MTQTNYTLGDKLRAVGPGAVVTASFIGPGTVTTVTRAGASFGFALLWTVIFSIVATIILQEMSARIGIITGSGLGEAIVRQFKTPAMKFFSILLVGGSITIGCLAYMSGDLTGTALGLEGITNLPLRVLAPLMGVLVGLLLLRGSTVLLEKLLTGLVAIMALVFVTTMIVIKPAWGEVFQGVVPSLPSGSGLLIISLIGTTIVPYNFFLHAGNASETWNDPKQLELSRWDIGVSITIGGLITAAILITSGAMLRGNAIENATDISVQLEPLLGSWASLFMSIGLFAAGLSSAIASPLGVSYTLAGLLGWEANFSDKRFKISALIVVVFGTVITLLGLNPMTILLVAQALNGIILPVVAIYLVYLSSKDEVLGAYINGPLMKLLGIAVCAVTIMLGGYAFITAMQGFF